jgi:hypothetical protein
MAQVDEAGVRALYRSLGERIESLQNTPAAFHGRRELIAAMTEELREALRREKNRG